MRRQDVGQLATIAFIFCVSAFALGLSLMEACDSRRQLSPTFDDKAGAMR